MKIFEIILVIGICCLITMGTVFSGAMFRALAIEGSMTPNGSAETATVKAHEQTSAWIYIIAILLIISVIVAAFKLFRDSATGTNRS
jgi:Na+/H+ antiporter NhaC